MTQVFEISLSNRVPQSHQLRFMLRVFFRSIFQCFLSYQVHSSSRPLTNWQYDNIRCQIGNG